MNAIETYTKHGCTIEICPDFDPENPREWSNLGTMVCFHGRYNLGDKHDYQSPDAFLNDPAMEGAVILPLYLYDHSGITMQCAPFTCPWDSGQVGWIVATRETVMKEFGGKRLTAKRRTAVERILRGEVETYDQYLTGDVYGFTVTRGEEEESCWGFYGVDCCRQEAESVAEYLDRAAHPLFAANMAEIPA